MDIILPETDLHIFKRLYDAAKEWGAEHKVAVGVIEMAIGAGAIAWGVSNGVIDVGSQLVGTQLGGMNTESIVGAAGGTGFGAVAGAIVGSIGVAGMGSAIGIPVALVVGGMAAVLGMAGYSAGDIAHHLATPAVDFNSFVGDGSVLLIGVALLVDGARRSMTDPNVESKLNGFRDNVLQLGEVSSKVIARTREELMGYVQELQKLPETTIDASVTAGTTAASAVGGAAAGGALAAGSVTVLGSGTLGGMAVSLGLVSAPIWPVIAGVAGGAGLGYAAYKAARYWRNKPKPPTETPDPALLPGSDEPEN